MAAYTVMIYVDFIFVAAFLSALPMRGGPGCSAFQYGAGNHAELKKPVWQVYPVIAALSLVMNGRPPVLLAGSGGIFLWAMTSERSALWEMTHRRVPGFALSFLFKGWNIFGSGFFTALGDGRLGILAFLRTLLPVRGVLLLPLAFQLEE